MIRHDGIGQIDLTLIAGCGFGSPSGWPKQHAPPSSRLLQLTLRVAVVSRNYVVASRHCLFEVAEM
jgi:hypothetical protein